MVGKKDSEFFKTCRCPWRLVIVENTQMVEITNLRDLPNDKIILEPIVYFSMINECRK